MSRKVVYYQAGGETKKTGIFEQWIEKGGDIYAIVIQDEKPHLVNISSIEKLADPHPDWK